MKIHRTKIGCLSRLMQRSVSQNEADKTSETSSLEANHSAGSVHAEEAQGATPIERERIKFPQANQATDWADLDAKLCEHLKQVVVGPISEKIRLFGDTIYEFCKEKYGIIEVKTRKTQGESRRQKEIKEVRRQKKEMRRNGKQQELSNEKASRRCPKH